MDVWHRYYNQQVAVGQQQHQPQLTQLQVTQQSQIPNTSIGPQGSHQDQCQQLLVPGDVGFGHGLPDMMAAAAAAAANASFSNHGYSSKFSFCGNRT